MRLRESLYHYLRCQRGFLGLGGDKKTHSTATIGREDADFIRRQRESGQNLQDLANQGGPWVSGANPYTTQGMDMYGNLMGQYGDMAGQYGGMAGQAYGNAMGMGLQGLGGYVNPMMQQYAQQTDPEYQKRLQEAFSMGGTLGTAPGQAAGQNIRGELFRSDLTGNVMGQRAQELGGIANQFTQLGSQMLMGDRARMGSLGGQFAGLQNQGLAGQMDANRNLMLGGDYLRNIDNQMLTDEWQRALAGHQAMQGSYGGPITQKQTNVEEGSVFGDLMGIAGMAGGMLLGGPAGAAAGGSMLSGLGGGGGGPNMPSLFQNPQSWFGGQNFMPQY